MPNTYNDTTLFAAQIPASVNAVANSGTPLVAYFDTGSDYTIQATSTYEKLEINTNTVRINGALTGWDMTTPGRFTSQYAQRILACFRLSLIAISGIAAGHLIYCKLTFHDVSQGTTSNSIKSVKPIEQNQRLEMYIPFTGNFDTGDYLEIEVYGNAGDKITNYTLELDTYDRYMVYVSED